MANSGEIPQAAAIETIPGNARNTFPPAKLLHVFSRSKLQGIWEVPPKISLQGKAARI